jgi:hypothetical protein
VSCRGLNGSEVRRATGATPAEFQAALLLAQMERLESEPPPRAKCRASDEASRGYGCTRNAYHLYMFRYDPSAFAGLPRAQFLKALRAEGLPALSGYSPLNKSSCSAIRWLRAATRSCTPRRNSPSGQPAMNARPTTACAARLSGSLKPCSSESAVIWIRSLPQSRRSAGMRVQSRKRKLSCPEQGLACNLAAAVADRGVKRSCAGPYQLDNLVSGWQVASLFR